MVVQLTADARPAAWKAQAWLAGAALLCGSMCLPGAGGGSVSYPAGLEAVIVRAAGPMAQAERVVAHAGGQIDRELHLINGFVAHVSPAVLPRLARSPAIFGIAPDGKVTFASTTTAYETSPYSASNDAGSLFNVVRSIGANQLWNQHDSGQGIGVALIDSGVTPVGALAGGNVVNGPDLSLDAGTANLRYLDDFGHGTHLAGIIAGRDSTARNYGAYNDPAFFTGVAPDATLVNVKVGAADGSVDVSQVIAGLDWVVAHKNDPGLNIRVVNLSFGTDSSQAYSIDPLAYAAEAAWHAGLVVVTAAGNEGNATSVMTDPAIDPFVLAVGADGHYDKDRNKLYLTSFSDAGSPNRLPDLVAPGQSIVSLRDTGSYVDANFPTGLVSDPSARFFRGSGTSQAAAVVSGVAADLLSKYPSLTPDQVKGLLRQNAQVLSGVATNLQGAGEVDASKLASLDPTKIAPYSQSWPLGNGSGSLEAARGGAHLVGANGLLLSGETTAFGTTFTGSSWTNNAWDGASWQGGYWSGHSWTADSWTGHSWSSDNWAGHSWSGNSWSGHSWSGSGWSCASWSDATWSGHSWSDTTWG
jgi:serine protease AprX